MVAEGQYLGHTTLQEIPVNWKDTEPGQFKLWFVPFRNCKNINKK